MYHMHHQLQVHMYAPYTHTRTTCTTKHICVHRCTIYTYMHTCAAHASLNTYVHHQTPPKIKMYLVGLPPYSMKDQVKMRDLCWISCFCWFSGAFHMKSTFSGAFHERHKMSFRVFTKFRSFDNERPNIGTDINPFLHSQCPLLAILSLGQMGEPYSCTMYTEFLAWGVSV